MSDPLALYDRELPTKSLLTPDAELALARKVEKGDADARHALIEDNVWLVATVAKQYADRGLDRGTLLRAGHAGLETALDNYDYRRGYKLSTTATYYVREAIEGALTK